MAEKLGEWSRQIDSLNHYESEIMRYWRNDWWEELKRLPTSEAAEWAGQKPFSSRIMILFIAIAVLVLGSSVFIIYSSRVFRKVVKNFAFETTTPIAKRLRTQNARKFESSRFECKVFDNLDLSKYPGIESLGTILSYSPLLIEALEKVVTCRNVVTGFVRTGHSWQQWMKADERWRKSLLQNDGCNIIMSTICLISLRRLMTYE